MRVSFFFPSLSLSLSLFLVFLLFSLPFRIGKSPYVCRPLISLSLLALIFLLIPPRPCEYERSLSFSDHPPLSSEVTKEGIKKGPCWDHNGDGPSAS